MNIGIVGLGYVGNAILFAATLAKQKNVFTYDIDESKNPNCSSLPDLVKNSDFIYIAVPTPMNLHTGECDTRIISTVIKQIVDCATTSKVLIIKSTVPPGTTEFFQQAYSNHTFLFSPEFLTEANANTDFLIQQTVYVGKPSLANMWIAEAVGQQLRKLCRGSYSLQIHDATTLELYKYVTNAFLATKVSFANEMKTISDKLKVDWNSIASLLKRDNRMGTTHWDVPGPDGHYGYGGTCFPKDISELINLSNTLNVEIPILSAVWNRNVEVDRPERDWETSRGRAVSE